MRNTHWILLRTISLFGLLLLSSCIQEDFSNCPPSPLPEEEIRIYFSYSATGSSASKAINPTDFDRLNLYVYDWNNKLVGEWVDEAPTLNTDYYISLLLKPGQYSFVAWGSLRDSYVTEPATMVPGVTDLNASTLKLIRDSDNIVRGAVHPLFHSSLLMIKVLDIADQRFVMPLTQNTNLIRVQTEGLAPSGDRYTLSIADDNGRYNFQDNSIAADTPFTYLTTCTKNAQLQLYGALTVMRLLETRPIPVLTLKNETQGTVLYQANLIDLLLQLQQQGANINFDTTHIFDILLTFTQDARFPVEVRINGWKLVEDDERQLTP